MSENAKNEKLQNKTSHELFMETQRREIITGYLDCALWEYNIEEKCQYQYKKLDGKWMEQKEPLYNYRETMLEWGLVHPDDISIFISYCDSLDNGESNFSYDMRLLGDDSDFIWISYTGKAVYDENGKAVSVVGVTYDVSEKYGEVKEMKGSVDRVTGLFDSACLNLMSVEVDNLPDESSAALVLFDIDSFSRINDKFGNVFGDYILAQVGNTIKNEFSKNSTLGRLGGDQFVLLLKNYQSVDKLRSRIKSLIERFRLKKFNHDAIVSVSAGAARLDKCESRTFDSLINAAEVALYMAKQSGGNCCRFYRADDRFAMPPDCSQIKFLGKYSPKDAACSANITDADMANIKSEIRYSNAILENKNVLAYTINPDTFEIKYTTNHMTKSFSNIKQGDTCYKAIMGYNTVCENCPAVMLNDRVDKQTSEIYSKYRHAWFSTTASKLDSDSGSQECLLCLTNVTQFMDRVQSHDKLTGILTFDKFEIDCMSNFEKLSDNYFVASVKLVRFGDINDEYGFETGNLVLKEIASKFSRTVMKDEAVCRANGANFFALLKADVYWKVENRLNALFISISDSLKEMIPDIQISMVAGIYQITPEDKQFNSCLDKANFVKKKLTDKKFVNKNEILTYDKTLDDELSARKDIERNMYNALENNEFKVFYQPKVSLENEKIYGAEALVRWIKADGEIISPELFVPIFEENEFVVEMDFYVYDVVMRDMTKLLQEGFELPIISLNVSKQHFYDGEFTEKFTSLVDSYGIPHEYIELELTETTFFGNLDHMIEIINHLRMDLGFRVSVDDFGSGYSSLNLISVLPVDVLKIDGKFFMTNKMSTKNKKVIETILQLATTLNFDTVSEGVETEEQVEFLKKTNCDAVQGYFYYRPMKFEDFKALLK